MRTYCRIAIEEACKRYKIELIVLEVLEEHSHMMVDLPRTLSDAKTMQLLKGFTSYLLFRLVPDFRKRYPKRHFWSEGYFCEGVGFKEFNEVFDYVKNQWKHHH